MKYFLNEYYPHGYDSPDYTRIVNDFHYQRLNALPQDALSNDAQALLNNHQTNDNRIFGPVILSGVNSSTKISREEIFGPILVVVSYEKIDQIIEDLINKPKPLALFIFSQQKKRINYILKNLSSGTVALNSTSIQFLHHELPFGGVNNSGIGKTHGYFGFLDFSNQRAVLKQKNGLTAFKFFRPPYTDFTKRLVKVVMKYI